MRRVQVCDSSWHCSMMTFLTTTRPKERLMSPDTTSASSSRRTFLKQSTAAVVGGTLAATLGSARMAHAAGSDILKVGLIGCGGRGKGAAVNAMNAEDNVRLTALADLFPDQMKSARGWPAAATR